MANLADVKAKKVAYIYVYFLCNSKSKSYMIMSSVPTVSGDI